MRNPVVFSKSRSSAGKETVYDLRVNFGKSETRINQNDKVFSKITCFFGASKPPRSGPSKTAMLEISIPIY